MHEKTCINRFAMLCKNFITVLLQRKVQGVVISSEDNLPLIGAFRLCDCGRPEKAEYSDHNGISLMWMVSSLSLYLRG